MSGKDYLELLVWLGGSGTAIWAIASSVRRPGLQARRLRWRSCGGLALLQMVPLDLFLRQRALGEWGLTAAVALLAGIAITCFYLGRHRVRS